MQSLHVTATDESDIASSHALLHGKERSVHADSATRVWPDARRSSRCKPKVEIAKKFVWYVAIKRGKVVSMAERELKELTVPLERKKAQIGARVEHPFHIDKNLFGHKDRQEIVVEARWSQCALMGKAMLESSKNGSKLSGSRAFRRRGADGVDGVDVATE
jgi:IS5 family transposase